MTTEINADEIKSAGQYFESPSDPFIILGYLREGYLLIGAPNGDTKFMTKEEFKQAQLKRKERN